jgi:hypothetical protein
VTMGTDIMPHAASMASECVSHARVREPASEEPTIAGSQGSQRFIKHRLNLKVFIWFTVFHVKCTLK